MDDSVIEVCMHQWAQWRGRVVCEMCGEESRAGVAERSDAAAAGQGRSSSKSGDDAELTVECFWCGTVFAYQRTNAVCPECAVRDITATQMLDR